MKRYFGFALLEVLLAVILMTIAAGASYTLVKSFRTNSATQQFIRYATTITQNYMPFLESEATSGTTGTSVYNAHQLSKNFLISIGIPQEDLDCPDNYCYVNSGMHILSGSDEAETQINFDITTHDSDDAANYFLLSVVATGGQINQILQSASSLFSVYYSEGGGSTTSSELLSKDELDNNYHLYLVFPKSGNTIPVDVHSFQPQDPV